MPAVSFIIPAYNIKDYIGDCLNSILMQNCRDYEVCIIDDGSTDGTSAICDEYAAAFSQRGIRYKLLHQQNKGVSTARNNALNMAKGDYIWFVDADDSIIDGSLQYIVMLLNRYKCDTIFFGNQTFTGIETGVSPVFEPKEKFLEKINCFCNPQMIFNRTIIEQQQLRFTSELKMGEDLEFQYKYLIHCNAPVAIPYALYRIRERAGSASRNQASYTHNFRDTAAVLTNMAHYCSDTDALQCMWLQKRIRERFKSLLQAGWKSADVKMSEIKTTFANLLALYKDNGFEDLCTGSLFLARINVRLYLYIYYLRHKLRI